MKSAFLLGLLISLLLTNTVMGQGILESDLMGEWKVMEEQNFDKKGNEIAGDAGMVTKMNIVMKLEADSVFHITSKLHPQEGEPGKWWVTGRNLMLQHAGQESVGEHFTIESLEGQELRMRIKDPKTGGTSASTYKRL